MYNVKEIMSNKNKVLEYREDFSREETKELVDFLLNYIKNDLRNYKVEKDSILNYNNNKYYIYRDADIYREEDDNELLSAYSLLNLNSIIKYVNEDLYNDIKNCHLATSEESIEIYHDFYNNFNECKITISCTNNFYETIKEISNKIESEIQREELNKIIKVEGKIKRSRL